MEWLKKLVDGSNSDDQAAYLSAFGAAVMNDLTPLSNNSPSLMKDTVRYILKGDPEDVLIKLRSNNEYGELLGLGCCLKNYSDKKRAVFKNVEPDKAECYMRLLQVYESD